jgi:dTDP-4-amino-4,6-dideoxygalactose transaminase
VAPQALRGRGHWSYEVLAPGLKYNMTNIEAALGLWELRKLDQFQEWRWEVVAAYYRDGYGYRAAAFPVAYHSFQRLTSLPLNSPLSDQGLGGVIGTVLDVIRAYRR